MLYLTHSPQEHTAWNKGKLIGQKPPLKLKEIWAIRTESWSIMVDPFQRFGEIKPSFQKGTRDMVVRQNQGVICRAYLATNSSDLAHLNNSCDEALHKPEIVVDGVSTRLLDLIHF